MDWTVIFIMFGFFLTGAAFFGFPIGLLIGIRSERRRFGFIPVPVIRSRCRLESVDILNADTLEEVK